MKNIFTIDLEDWYHANYEEGLFENKADTISTVERNVDHLLELFDQYNVRATFFCLGFVVEQHPEMVRKISKMGHEIASHGYGHHLVYDQTKEQYREDIRKSKALLEDVTGKRVVGYRAPSWSITEKSLWALDVLAEEGFLYSSSIFPTKNFLYGIPYAPRFKHDCEIYGRDLPLINVPPSTKKIGSAAIPFSGGAYFRLLPVWMIDRFTKLINEKEREPVVFYLHPREIDREQPRLRLGLRDRLIHYWGVRGCEKKLIKVLRDFEFETMTEMLNF